MPETKNPAELAPLSRGPVRRFIRRALRNWRERHRVPFNFAIHLLGIPIAVASCQVSSLLHR